MANLTFKETTIDFRFTSSIILPPIKYLSGNMSDERLLSNYDLYVNDDRIDTYHLTVLETGANSADYKLYFQDEYSNVTEVFGSHDFKNFPLNVMFKIYSSIDSLQKS